MLDGDIQTALCSSAAPAGFKKAPCLRPSNPFKKEPEEFKAKMQQSKNVMWESPDGQMCVPKQHHTAALTTAARTSKCTAPEWAHSERNPSPRTLSKPEISLPLEMMPCISL